MKLPIPLLLYVAAAGLFGLAGWTVYQMLPLWKGKVREAATERGQKDGMDRIGRGRGQGPVSVDWRYSANTASWWENLRQVNLIGKLPPPPPEPEGPANGGATAPEPVDVRPLEEIIELISLVYDGADGGRGGNSHVVVRFKPEANVSPPDWWVRENSAPSSVPAAMPAAPRDTARPAGGRPPAQPAGAARPGARVTTPMPTSTVTGREIVQMLYAQGGDDPRRSAELWPVNPSSPDPTKRATLGRIRLVRVAENAQSAWFVRELPPAKAGDPAPEPKEEELLKTSAGLSQDVLRALRELQGRPTSARPVADRTEAPIRSGSWREVEETTREGNTFHIGRNDEQRIRAGEDVFEQFSLDTYSSRSGNVTGLIVRNVDPQLAARFGVAAGEVLIEVNGKKVESKAQAIQTGKKDYQRGVRTFVTKWMVNGQVVERTYQAPDK